MTTESKALGENPSAQDVFDHVVQHLGKQRAKSLHPTLKDQRLLDELGRQAPMCAYRGENNMKCAVGACLRDEEWAPTMEGQSFLPVAPFRLNNTIGLLIGLQQIHDCTDVASWPNNLRTIAANFSLNADAIDAGF